MLIDASSSVGSERTLSEFLLIEMDDFIESSVCVGAIYLRMGIKANVNEFLKFLNKIQT